jgi:hypothetical protein
MGVQTGWTDETNELHTGVTLYLSNMHTRSARESGTQRENAGDGLR